MTLDRKTEILNAALALAAKKGYLHITRQEIAARAKIATTLVSYYFKNVPSLRVALMHEAVVRQDYTVIAQGLAARDPIAMAAPVELRTSAALSLVG